MFSKRKDQSDINCLLPGSRFLDLLTFGSFSRCFCFGGGSSTRSSQSTVNKDNSAVGEDEFQNVTDGGVGARDQALAIKGGGTRSRTAVDLSSEDNSGQVTIGSENQIDINSIDSEVTGQAFDFAGDLSDDAFGFGKFTVQEALDIARISQDSANRTSQAANTVLAKKSDDAPSAMAETFQKNVLIGLGIIAAAIIFSQFPNS